MTPRCEYCDFAKVGYTVSDSTMAELRCMRTSEKGRSIYWAFDTYKLGSAETSKSIRGIDDVVAFVRNQKEAPKWCPFRKVGAGIK